MTLYSSEFLEVPIYDKEYDAYFILYLHILFFVCTFAGDIFDFKFQNSELNMWIKKFYYSLLIVNYSFMKSCLPILSAKMLRTENYRNYLNTIKLPPLPKYQVIH
jgi:hypothetical protein